MHPLTCRTTKESPKESEVIEFKIKCACGLIIERADGKDFIYCRDCGRFHAIELKQGDKK